MRRPRAGRRVDVHFYPSTFRFESRMLKETATALDSGAVDEILILARWEAGLPEREDVDERRHVRRLRTPLGDRLPGFAGRLVALLEWYVRTLAVMVRERPVAVNPHSLPVLPIGLVVKLLRGSRLIYDTHELESETVGASGARRAIGRALERACMPFVDQVVVVNESIRQWYAERHPRTPVLCVRNVPLRRLRSPARHDLLRERFAIPADHLVFLYQGVLHAGRGIELLCQAFDRLPVDRHIVFLGYGSLEDHVRAAEARRPNVHFHPAVPPQDVLRYTGSADVGVSMIENVCLSYHLSLPNKLFEYVSSAVPFVASDFPEMRRFAEETGAGWVVPVELDAVVEVLGGIDAAAIAARSAAAAAAREHLSWELESEALAEMYRRVVGARGS